MVAWFSCCLWVSGLGCLVGVNSVGVCVLLYIGMWFLRDTYFALFGLLLLVFDALIMLYLLCLLLLFRLLVC